MLCYRRLLNGSGLFPLFKQLLETEMTKSPPIIVREYIFQASKLTFRVVLKDKSGKNEINLQ